MEHLGSLAGRSAVCLAVDVGPPGRECGDGAGHRADDRDVCAGAEAGEDATSAMLKEIRSADLVIAVVREGGWTASVSVNTSTLLASISPYTETRPSTTKLCSCLDVIGDTELACSAYEQMPDAAWPGSSYILLYGFLQALFLQQDAVHNLHEALSLPYEPDPLLREIQELRNDAAGHPTQRDRGKERRRRSATFLGRRSAGPDFIDNNHSNEWPPVFRHVSLSALLETQHVQLKQALEALLQSLQKEEMEHREHDLRSRSCYTAFLIRSFEPTRAR
jgi:hypothetical protein